MVDNEARTQRQLPSHVRQPLNDAFAERGGPHAPQYAIWVFFTSKKTFVSK